MEIKKLKQLVELLKEFKQEFGDHNPEKILESLQQIKDDKIRDENLAIRQIKELEKIIKKNK